MKRKVAVFAISSALVLGLAAWLHAPLLRALAPSSACPVGAPTLDSMEHTRVAAMQPLRGTLAAPTRSALGFELGHTTVAMAERPGCAWEIPAALLRCTEGQGSLVARFDAKGLLVGLDRRGTAVEPAVAVQAFEARVRSYETEFGAPHTRGGDASVAFLSEPLRQAGVRYRFEDLTIDVTVTQLGRGVVLREQVREIPPAPRGQGG